MLNLLKRSLQLLTMRQDLFLALMLLMAIFMMILPLPTALVDLLIVINLALSITLLMIAIYLREPLELSVFPSLLLITTLYRLALTISTSRLVLLQHDAGHIVEAFGQFVVGGNLAVGLIMFLIITIVQFMVITKGAERVAEVSARFSLDGMPGKQMSIDGDMRAGIIDATQAARQRERVQKESGLYGAMDGAMKFVKGDAIASIIIIFINIIGGIAIGIFYHEMSTAEAVNTYSVLSIGDGLAAQIPSLLISITAGIIVTRVPGEDKQSLASDLVVQIQRQPEALWMASIMLLLLALLPGFPFFYFASFALLIALPALLLNKRRKKGLDAKTTTDSIGSFNQSDDEKSMPGAIPLMVVCAINLQDEALSQLINQLRWQRFEQFGVPLPEVRLKYDVNLPSDRLLIYLYQEIILSIDLPEQALMIARYHNDLPLRVERLNHHMGKIFWMNRADQKKADAHNITFFQGSERIIHCLNHVFDRYTGEFLGIQEVRYLMDAMEGRYAELVKEVQRQIAVSKVAEILQRLVEERLSIRDLRAIFGALASWAPREKDPLMLTEYVRIALRRHICQRFCYGNMSIKAIRIGQGIEALIRESLRQTAIGTYAALSLSQTKKILTHIEDAVQDQHEVVLIAALDIRRFLRKIIVRKFFSLPVLSWQEIGDECEINLIGTIDMIGEGLDETA